MNRRTLLPLLLGLAATAPASADERTSADYGIPTDTIDAGGARAVSTAYTHGGSLGGIGGGPVASGSGGASPLVTVQHGFVGQLYTVDIDVALVESADPVAAGDSLTYVVTASNLGPADATGVTVSQVLVTPSGVTLASATPSVGTTFNATTWSIGPLAAGGEATLTVILNVASSAVSGTDVIADTATVTATDDVDSDPGNDAVTERTSIDGKRYYDWQTEHFSAADLADANKEATVWGAQANPDRDFRLNIFEFFHGSDPNAFDEDPAVALGLNGNRTSFAFQQRDDLGGITFEFLTSGDPQTGFAAIGPPTSEAATEAGFSDVVYEDTEDVQVGTPRFGKLVLEQE